MDLLTAILFILFEAIGEGLLNRTQSTFRDFIFKGWVCTTAGAGGTAVFTEMANLD